MVEGLLTKEPTPSSSFIKLRVRPLPWLTRGIFNIFNVARLVRLEAYTSLNLASVFLVFLLGMASIKKNLVVFTTKTGEGGSGKRLQPGFRQTTD